MAHLPLPKWKETYMRIKHAEETAEEMAQALSISLHRVIEYCTKHGYKPMPRKATINRPPAQYSNENVYLKYSTDENID